MRMFSVAPFAGAWIETAGLRAEYDGFVVAPFAGAWIETGQGTCQSQCR